MSWNRVSIAAAPAFILAGVVAVVILVGPGVGAMPPDADAPRGAGGSPGRTSPDEPLAPQLTITREKDKLPDQTGDWPCWRGPHLDGISREKGLLKNWPAGGPPVLWNTKLWGGYSSIAVAGGRLFTHTAKNKKEEIVLCLDPVTGKELWRYSYPCDYDRVVSLRENFDHGPRATPAVAGDHVYTIGTTGIVLCLDAKTGEKIWERDLLKMAGGISPPQGFCSSPLVVGDHLYVHPGGQGCSVAALHKRDGSIVWQALDDIPSYSSPIAIEVHGRPQIVYFTGEAVVGMAPADGKLLWRQLWQTQPQIHGATPLVVDGQVFISSNYGTGAALLRLPKEGNPEVVWKSRAMQNQYATSVLHDGHIYGFSGFRLRCIAAATGETRWDETGLGKGSLIVAGGRLVILSERGDLVLAEATPKGYTEISRCAPLKGSCCTVPALAGGRLFLRNDRLLVAVDLRDQRP
jgi:outer membrane protein assembly factor BamB